MLAKEIVREALNEPMTRKQFLQKLGILMLTVCGLTAVLHVLGEGQSTLGYRPGYRSKVTVGYGSSTYGGKNSSVFQ